MRLWNIRRTRVYTWWWCAEGLDDEEDFVVVVLVIELFDGLIARLLGIIKQSISKKYGILNAYEIVDAAKIEHEKEILYLAEIRRGTELYELEIDETGEILSEEKK